MRPLERCPVGMTRFDTWKDRQNKTLGYRMDSARASDALALQTRRRSLVPRTCGEGAA